MVWRLEGHILTRCEWARVSSAVLAGVFGEGREITAWRYGVSGMGYGMFWARGAMRSRGWGADGRVGAIGAMVVSRHRHSGTAGLPVKQHKWTVMHVCLFMWSGWCADAVFIRGAPLFFLTRWVDRCGGWRSSPGCLCLSVHPPLFFRIEQPKQHANLDASLFVAASHSCVGCTSSTNLVVPCRPNLPHR